MNYWVTGRKGSGKTTLAYKLAKQIKNCVVIDADEVREYFDTGYTVEGRIKNQQNLTSIAKILNKQGFNCIIACVSPIKRVRYELQQEIDAIEIQLPFGTLWEGTEYEE